MKNKILLDKFGNALYKPDPEEERVEMIFAEICKMLPTDAVISVKKVWEEMDLTQKKDYVDQSIVETEVKA